MKPVIIYGNSVLSQMLFYDAGNHKDFVIACFAADKEYLSGSTFLGLPQIDFDHIDAQYPSSRYDMLAVLGGYSAMRSREKYYLKAKSKGYQLRNYIGKNVDMTALVQMGDNNIVFGPSHIGFEGVMGSNNIIRQNVYLGHNFDLGDHIFIGAGCNIGGKSIIKSTSYIGMGATILNDITIEAETLVGAGSVVIHNTEPFSKNVGNPARVIGYHAEEGIKMT